MGKSILPYIQTERPDANNHENDPDVAGFRSIVVRESRETVGFTKKQRRDQKKADFAHKNSFKKPPKNTAAKPQIPAQADLTASKPGEKPEEQTQHREKA